MKRIHICGIYGAGKSMLARELSRRLGIPWYSLDDIKYEVKYSKIRPVAERIRRVQNICRQSTWITEGTWSNFAEDAFKKSELVIHLLPLRFVQYYRILKRHLGRQKEENDTLLNALKLVVNARKYYHTREPVSLYAHRALIRKYGKQCVVIRTQRELRAFVARISC